MKLSIVSTMFKSEVFIAEFCERVVLAAQQLIGDDFELILVNDGSPDASLQRALALREEIPQLKIVDLSRNFGHHTAIIAGLEAARGERVLLMDCDLEEQPEWLSLFAETMQREEADVVFGVQEQRTASATSNFFGKTFWSLLNVMSKVQIPSNPMTCRLMTRRYVDALLSVQDRVLYLAGTFAWTGFKQVAVPLTKTSRLQTQASSYDLSRKLVQVADSFASFSAVPLTLLFIAGFFIWAGSILFALYIFVEKLLFPETILSGFTSMMISVWFLGGAMILGLGTVGLYVGKIFQEAKRRPQFIVRNIYRCKNEQ
ncbi:glycosyltransferase family 2 protein [Pseudomonas machongensis]